MTNQNNFSFEFENLMVDWISFKFQNFDEKKENEITYYLFKLGFNSYQQSGKLASPMKKSIQINPSNEFEVLLVKEGPYWKGTTVNFSGTNAPIFYKFIQETRIDWEIFSFGVLSRFNLSYQREIKKSEKASLTTFFENCQKKICPPTKTSCLERNKRGWVLKIGNRRSNKYYRIYETENYLKFKYEMKGKLIENYHKLLISNELDELEKKLSSDFWVSFGKLLPLESSYLDWLVRRLRPIRKQASFSLAFNSDYLTSETIADPETFILLLQFLIYAKTLDFEMEYLGGIRYRKVSFRLRDFVQFQNPTIQPITKYQLRKTKNLLDQLQKGCFITSFTDKWSQSLVVIPQVKFELCPREKYWIGKVFLVENLFFYEYPFLILDLFRENLGKVEFKVRVQFLQVFSSVSLEKTFLIEKFFQSYGSALLNQNKTKIKKEFIQMVGFFRKLKLIEETYEVI
jgi:hypothetical protein